MTDKIRTKIKNETDINRMKSIVLRSIVVLFLVTIIVTSGMTSRTPSQVTNSLSSSIPTQVISTNSTSTSLVSNIAIDSHDNVHIVWYDFTNYNGSGTDADIFYKMWNSTTLVWSNIVVVSIESTSSSYSPSIAVDSQDNLHVVWWDYTNYDGSGTDADIFYKMWNSTTYTWGNTAVVSTESTLFSANPSMTVDSQDNLHVVWWDNTNYDGSGTDSDIFYKIWNSTSMVWGNTMVVSTESTSSSSSDPSIAIDNQDNLHILWSDYTDYDGSGTDSDIFYKIWNSTAFAWGNTAVVSTESNGSSSTPSIAVDSQNKLHVVWKDFTNYDGSGTDSDIFYKISNSTSNTWGNAVVVSTESTSSSSNPWIAVDSLDNHHIVWEDYTDYDGSGTDNDVFYKKWDSAGFELTTTEVISTESTRGIIDGAIYPYIAVDSLDNLHISWEDETNYLGAGTDADIFYKSLPGNGVATITVTTTETQTQTITSPTTQTITEPGTTIIITESGTTITVTESEVQLVTTVTETGIDKTETETVTVTTVSTQTSTNTTDDTNSTSSAPFPGLYVIFLSLAVMIYRRKV